MKLNNLLKLDKVVEEVLREDKLARRDDCYLILRVIQKMNPKLATETFFNVMINARFYRISFESITRCRRRLQKKYPELADSKIESARQAEQLEYMQYANENHIPFMENTMDDLEELTIRKN